MAQLTTIRGLALMPLYDWPEYHGDTDALWDRIRVAGRDQGLDLPSGLEHRNHSISAWMDDGLVFSQLCGSPWYRHHRARARYLASSVLAVQGAPAGQYFSHVIVRDGSGLSTLDDIEQAGDARFAFNEPDSQSGVHCLRARFDMDAQLAGGLHSGGHRHSIDAVLAGDADFAAIDACSFRLYAGLFPARLDGLRIVAQTPLRPAPVLITSATLDGDTAARLQRSVLTALAGGLGDGLVAGGGGQQDYAGGHAFVGAANLGAEAYRVFEDDARAMPARSTRHA